MQTSAFEVYVLGLLAVLERLPIPVAIAFDREGERVQGNRAFRMLYGLPAAENASLKNLENRPLRYQLIDERGTPVAFDDLPLRRAAVEGAEILDVPMRLVRADGREASLVLSAWPLRDSQGSIEGSIGIMLDVTEQREVKRQAEEAIQALRESERRYRLITEAMPEFVWLDAPDGSAIYANRRWLEYTGLSEEENEGLGWERVVHPNDLQRLEAERERTLRTGDPYEGECRYLGKDGKYRWFLFRSIAVRDESGVVTSWLGTATDIDKQKRAEAQQAFFARVSDVLSSTLDVTATLERIARLAVDALGTWCQIDLPDADGRLRVAVVAHQDLGKQYLLEELIDQHIYADNVPFGPPNVARTGKPEILSRVTESGAAVVIPEEKHQKIYRKVGAAGGLMVPLKIGDRILGVLGIASDDPSRLYTEFDVATAMELGRRGASALENAQSYAREHRVASTLQRALLPSTMPSLPQLSFDFAYASEAFKKGEAVGGDWYDAFHLDDGRIAISMGDVAGHGVDAAITMSTVRLAIRTAAIGGLTVRGVLSRANALFCLERRASMVTALYGIYDVPSRNFTYALAGHPRPLLVDDHGEFRVLPGAGPPLSDVFHESLSEEVTVTIPPSSTIVFYTDGLIEFKRDLLASTQRLHTVVKERYFLGEAHPAQSIIDLTLDAPQNDDIAVLVMRVDDPDAKSFSMTMPARGRSAPILRERLRKFAERCNVGEDRIAHMLNAAGEAVANAIEHAYAGGEGPVTLKARCQGDKLLVEIGDKGAWREPAGSGEGMRGRGRGIMESLVPKVSVEPGAQGTWVRLEI